MDEFGIRPSGLRASAEFEMKGVSPDPEKPHKLFVRHIGLSNPVVVNAMIKNRAAEDAEVDVDTCIARLVERGGITWENVCAPDGTPLAPEPERVERYLKACVARDYSLQVASFYFFAINPTNFAASTEDPTKLGEASRP